VGTREQARVGQAAAPAQARRPRVSVLGLKGLPASGGSARAGENLMRLLDGRYDFRVYNSAAHTSQRSGPYQGVTLVVWPRFPVRRLNTLFYYLCSLTHCLLRGGCDLVHLYHLDAAFVVPFLRLRYPVVAGHRARPQEFSKWGPLARRWFDLMEWIFYRFPADALTSVSREIVLADQDRTKRQILYIPNGVVLEDWPLEPGGGAGGYLLFAAGRMMETKGAHLLLEALHTLGYRGPLRLLGNLEHDRAYAERLRDQARGLDVEFLGLVRGREELRSVLHGARLIVCPSSHEGMSNMVLEAAAARRPLVLSDIPENRAVLAEDEACFFRSGDAADLATRLGWALEHGAELEERARRARARIERDFDWRELARRHDELYQRLLSTRGPIDRSGANATDARGGPG